MNENTCRPRIAAHPGTKPGERASAWRKWLGTCLCAGVTAALLGAQSAGAVTLTLVSQGQFPSGKILQIVMVTVNPGESIPWHYHTGTGWVTVVSGTLTDDAGCGAPLVTHPAGSVATEPAGHVHRLFNFGSEPAVFTGTLIFPGCDPNNGTVFVSGPNCEGNSGNSHREPIPHCNDPSSD